MPPKQTNENPTRGRGRPPLYGELPPDARKQSYRATDEEHAALMKILAGMRSRKHRKTKGR